MEKGNEKVILVVEGTNVKFGSISFGAKLGTIDGLKLNFNGVILEHPDLLNREDWRQEAIIRFKAKVKSFNSEEDIVEYLIEDLQKHNYIPKLKQRQGFRPEVIQ